MSITSREQARQFIEEVVEENGLFTSDEIEQMRKINPRWLKKVEVLRSKLGKATKALTDNIFSKETRFVYELIQNAEDNRYEKAKSRGELPKATFTVTNDRIVIDLNEDGFTEANIKAICSIGESTKTNHQGYVGEKGIGFKSVFRVAHKVHIQSGFFSFAFNYRITPKATGLEMVTPILEKYASLEDGVGTRIVLDVLENYDRGELFRQFEDLPDTLLLFLCKLKVLEICLERSQNDTSSILYELKEDPRGNWLTIHKRMQTNSGSESAELRFMTFRESITDMPKDSHRVFKRTEDGESESINEAEVVLAFPVDVHDNPIVEDQDVFAFLPLRPAGFKFIIQSDFIALASREDIFRCAWNHHLRSKILQLFISRIQEFLEHEFLQFHWVRYLSADDISDPFWKPLQSALFRDLSKRKILLSSDGLPEIPSSLRFIPDSFKDHNGEPLFDDNVDSFRYISDSYTRDECATIRRLGVQELTQDEFITLVEQDLRYEENLSRMKAQSTNTEWHSRVAIILSNSLEERSLADAIRLLPLVPLVNGKWVVPKNASIFFPTCAGIAIPPQLPQLNIVDPNALANAERSTLFERLQVQWCKPQDVIHAIEARHAKKGSISNTLLVDDLVFLYWHHDKIRNSKPKVHVAYFDGQTYYRNSPWDRTNGWYYSPQQIGRYSAATVFKSDIPERLKKKMRFLRIDYYNKLEKFETRHGLSPDRWLQTFVGVKTTLQLLDCEKGKVSGSIGTPSPEFIDIASYAPELLLGIVKANWTDYLYAKSAGGNHTIRDIICEAEIPVLDSSSPVKVKETFLPNPDMMERIDKLGLLEGFGFIREIQHDDSNWRFLNEFGVGIEQDLGFWLAALKKARQKKQVKITVMKEIYLQIWSFMEKTEAQELTRQLFDSDQGLIYIPIDDSSEFALWLSPKNCLWEGPKWLDMARLSSIPAYVPLKELFVDIINVRNARLADILEHLCALSVADEDPVDLDLIYNHLERLARRGSQSLQQVKDAFKNKRLIFDHKDQDWYYSDDCIWAEDKIKLPGLVSIADQYRSTEKFFLDILEIESPQLEMHIDALKSEAESAQPSRERVVELIECICGYDPAPHELSELENCQCFPVHVPERALEWMTCSGAFIVGDRSGYLELFKASGRVPWLDFSLEEVHSFQKFLFGLGVQRNFLSVIVRAETDASNSSIHMGLTKDFRRKAYAICRILAHSASERALQSTTHIMELLRHVDVYESGEIYGTLSVSLTGRETVDVPASRAYAHLEADESKLILYVPSSNREQEVSLKTHLPELLLKHFGAQSLENETLEHAGIISLQGVERPSGEETREDPDFLRNRGIFSDTIVSQESTDIEQHLYTDVTRAARQSSRAASAPLLNRIHSGARIVTSGSPESGEDDADNTFWESDANEFDSHLYKKLLSICVNQGRSLLSVPRRGSTLLVPDSAEFFDRGIIWQAVAGNDQRSLIGAAGELFVFEWLSQLGLSTFDRSNWRSRIRARVKSHPEYLDLQSYTGDDAEITDIVHKDVDGRLTSLLIEQEYLDRAVWETQRPLYHIEVKSTINDLDTAFFVSPDQYELIRDHEVEDGDPAAEIVLIVRPFRLGTAGMGLKLFLDPARLRRQGKLEFIGKAYKVFQH